MAKIRQICERTEIDGNIVLSWKTESEQNKEIERLIMWIDQTLQTSVQSVQSMARRKIQNCQH